MGKFFNYAEIVGLGWFAIAAVILTVAELSHKILPGWKKRADALGFTDPIRRRLEITALVLAFSWSGFSAWREELTRARQ